MNKIPALFIACLSLAACNNGQAPKNRPVAEHIDSVTNVVDSSYYLAQKDSMATGNEYNVTCYVVMADTSASYSLLREEMFRFSKALSLPVDTMGRGYDPVRHSIVVPDTSSDESYAGEYLPRRSPEAGFSIEQLDFYRERAARSTMALVAGIYTAKPEADSALARLQKAAPRAFTQTSVIYMGCMH